MRRYKAKAVVLLLAGALALGLLTLAWAIGPGSSEAEQDAMHNCPQPGRWAISVWEGPDGTETGAALATCGEGVVAAAYYLDPQTQGWSHWLAGQPGMSTLATLNNSQGVIALGAVGAPGIAPTPAATFTSWREIGIESIWDPWDGTRLTRLHECSRGTQTDCVTAIMQDSGASREPIEFFRTTGWFLGDFQEMGRVDMGEVVDPWRANANVQPVFLNGTPLVVYPEDEVRPVYIGLDPDYEALVASFPDLSVFPGLSALETVSTLEGGGQRFVLQFDLVDGCHACGTGYRARIAFDFGVDGTYLGVDSFPLGLCWGGGLFVTPVSPSVPDCPALVWPAPVQ